MAVSRHPQKPTVKPNSKPGETVTVAGRARRKQTVFRGHIELNPADVYELASQGLTDEQISLALGCCRKTLNNKKAENPEIKRAIDAGRAQTVMSIANVLVKKALAGDKACAMFYLKTHGWSERAQIEHTSPDGSLPAANIFVGAPLTAVKALLDAERDGDEIM